jgi:hypothetical protein
LYIQPKNKDRVLVSEIADLADVRSNAKVLDVVIIDSWTKLDMDSLEFDKSYGTIFPTPFLL